MATTQSLTVITAPANGDLSSSQFRLVDINSSGNVAVVASAGAKGVGVLMNKPSAAAEDAEVAVAGVAKVVIGSGGVTAGNKVQSDASGGAIVASTSDHVFGTAMESVAAGAVGAVLLHSQHIIA